PGLLGVSEARFFTKPRIVLSDLNNSASFLISPLCSASAREAISLLGSAVWRAAPRRGFESLSPIETPRGGPAARTSTTATSTPRPMAWPPFARRIGLSPDHRHPIRDHMSG